MKNTKYATPIKKYANQTPGTPSESKDTPTKHPEHNVEINMQIWHPDID